MFNSLQALPYLAEVSGTRILKSFSRWGNRGPWQRLPSCSMAGGMRIQLSCLLSSTGVSLRSCRGGRVKWDEEPKQEAQKGRVPEAQDCPVRGTFLPQNRSTMGVECESGANSQECRAL